MAFSLPQVSTIVSGSFTVGLTIDNGTDVASAPLEVRFDSKILRLIDVAPGDYFSREGPQPILTKNIQNDTGSASIQIGRSPGSAGVSGSGTLVKLTFQAVGIGTAAVGIPNLTVRNSGGQVAAIGSPQMQVNVK